MGEQVVAGEQDPALLVPEDRVRRAVPGPVKDLRSVRSRSASVSPSCRPRSTCPLEPNARNAAPTEPSTVVRSVGDAVSAHDRLRELVIGGRAAR